jgi:hypothetical protein
MEEMWGIPVMIAPGIAALFRPGTIIATVWFGAASVALARASDPVRSNN